MDEKYFFETSVGMDSLVDDWCTFSGEILGVEELEKISDDVFLKYDVLRGLNRFYYGFKVGEA